MLRRDLLTNLIVFPTLGTTVLASANAWAAGLGVGQTAPDFSLKDVTGKNVKLTDFAGKFVVLEWTNPGCPFVQKHYGSGNMPATQKDALAKGVVWLSINSTAKGSDDYLEPPKLAAWLSQQKANPSAMLMDEDGKVGLSFGARTTPHLFIVNPKGQLVYAGGIDSIASTNAADIPRATNFIKTSLAEALAGRPLSNANTKAYGCSVKYAG